ncbi:uncharacterized protein LOC131842134 [Achroia grisella]|uniref:uncharacterized protein LOC131842134 n=1 Tax=Achroia grisella TaxID=688607 RepID=UPI0027D2C64D|nr:uncharacterized protein LOC131842134 [Achroia grisella]
MEKMYQYVESAVVNYKLSYCCWIAPVRIGIIVVGYFNLIAAIVSLVGTANETFSPTIMKVQEIILEDNASKPIPILAYSTDMSFTVLLLCGIYRNDIVLLQVYIYYTIATVVTSILVYSMVIAAIDVLLVITIIFSTIFQVYMLLLVWSAIVEIKEASADKNGDIKVVYSSVDQEIKEMVTKPVTDVESPSIADEPEAGPAPTDEETTTEYRDTKLETVKEEKEG